MDRIVEELIGIVGEANVLTTADDMAPYLTDWRGRYRGHARAVVRPAATAEVSAVLAACHAAAVPVVPQGGNTGLCGGATPSEAGVAVVLSLTRMNRIRSLDPDNNTVGVEAGCTLAALQEAAAAAERLFPLSLASEGSCTIGGNLSTNAGGVQVLRYGNTRELTLGLEVVLPDGRIWDGMRGLRKDNTGYDLKHLFIGAEGTLGVITAAVLKLFPAPRGFATAWAAVSDPAAAVRLLGRLRHHCGDRISAFELVGRPALDLVLKHIPGARDPFSAPTQWAVLIELSDSLEGEGLAETLAGALGAEMEAGLVLDAVVASSLGQAQALWALRENISEAQRIEGVSIKHDVSVPVSRIAEFLERADVSLKSQWPGVRIVAFGHIGDGNLHYNLSRSETDDNASFIARTEDVNRIVHDLVDALGGSISAEHGLGQLKRAEIRRYKSTVEMDMMEAIKNAFDPSRLMNPGKVL
ncbi:FAD-binding oxidoreductase [Azoarcus olearius]|uniref:Glycolate oxidase subunit GlcD n=1 Tax=Azoarcus sp. (strain BH72) TaxID=418699 RepID=A1K489_AZOSB|nr:FAD-binding oxidoreductase [Azoarcus olearius]CAL93644.1 putative glycolate oxidase subunit GlcD [Azoarcus olearius]